MSLAERLPQESAASDRWLSIVGIGEDGIDGLTPAAVELVRDAQIVFGGKRHLALAATLIAGTPSPWPSPFEGVAEMVLAQRGRRVCVLASGDPFFYGVGAMLAKHVDAGEMLVIPAPSCFSLAAGRLGWDLASTELLSLHGRALDLVRPHLHPGGRVLALTSDGGGPAALARLLREAGFGSSRITVLEALGGPRERVRSASAADFHVCAIDDLNLVGIEIVAAPDARIIPCTGGRYDDLFEHDGQISKREIRAMTLAALAPCRGELLWDIGAGSGSVAIEWMLSHPSLQAIAIEARADRAARIRRNASALGVPGLQIIEGEAPGALGKLPPPDAVFIGGGACDPGVVESAVAALPRRGRLVINAVTLATECLVGTKHAELGGELTRIAIARAGTLGSKTAWRAAMPVTQWAWVKP